MVFLIPADVPECHSTARTAFGVENEGLVAGYGCLSIEYMQINDVSLRGSEVTDDVGGCLRSTGITCLEDKCVGAFASFEVVDRGAAKMKSSPAPPLIV